MAHILGRCRRTVGLITALALCGLGAAGVPRMAAAAVPACQVDDFAASAVDGDVDGDRRPDLPVGVPNASGSGRADDGAVDIHLADGGRQRVTLDKLGLVDEGSSGARFGAALSPVEIEGDVCDDLAVGAPGWDERGAVLLLRGSRLGLATADPVLVVAPDGAPGDDFGATVATRHRQDGSTDLWVGAPGRAVQGQAEAGQVYHFVVSSTFGVTLAGTLSHATAGVPGAPAAGDRFGEVLAPAGQHVAVGVPRRTVQGQARAGEVVFVTGDAPSPTVQVFDQGSPSVAGAPEAGDQFGAALARGAVGVPGEDLGGHADAGMVQTFRLPFAGPVAPGRSYHQDTAGIPGSAERGDRFGAALAAGTWLLCQEQTDLAVGAPGESIGSAAGAGSVTVLSLPSEGPPCAAARAFSQRTNLPGRLAAGNRLGATLATLSGDREDEEDYRSTLVIGVPGQDTSVRDAGLVVTGLSRTAPVRGAIGGDQRDLAYGSVLAPLG